MLRFSDLHGETLIERTSMSETIIDDREMLQVRLWARVIPFDVRDPKACAEFGGHTLPAGYGTLQDPRTGKPVYAHRLSWELIHGEIPDGSVVRHLCDNPSCVRPGHLKIGTQKENMGDRKRSSREKTLPELSEEDVTALLYCYQTGRWSQGDLAEMFLGSGAGQPTIQRILSGKTHKKAKGPRTSKGRGKKPGRRSQ